MGEQCHTSSVLSSLDGMRSAGFICDFKILVQDVEFDTHRLILAANSGYFKEYFLRKTNLVSSIRIDNVHPEEMRQCIEYMYTSKYDFRLESVPKILEAAQFFKIPHLEEDCLKFLSDDLSPESCFHVLNLTRRSQPKVVRDMARNVIQNNLEIVVKSKYFKRINEEDLFHFIANVEPKIYWKAIITYCRGRENIFVRLVERIDFSRFSFHFLLTTVLSDPLTMYELPQTRLSAVKEIFSDHSRLKAKLNSKNCFLLKILASDPSSKSAVDPTSRITITSFMKEKFSLIKSEDGFRFLSKETVLSLLESLDVESEESKWEVILKWIKTDPRRVKNKEIFRELFHTIKLDKLSLDFLIEKLYSEDLVKNDAACMQSLMLVLITHIRRLQSDRETSPSRRGSGDARNSGDVKDAAKDAAEGLKKELEGQENSEVNQELHEDAAREAEPKKDSIGVTEMNRSSTSPKTHQDHTERSSPPSDSRQRKEDESTVLTGQSQNNPNDTPSPDESSQSSQDGTQTPKTSSSNTSEVTATTASSLGTEHDAATSSAPGTSATSTELSPNTSTQTVTTASSQPSARNVASTSVVSSSMTRMPLMTSRLQSAQKFPPNSRGPSSGTENGASTLTGSSQGTQNGALTSTAPSQGTQNGALTSTAPSQGPQHDATTSTAPSQSVDKVITTSSVLGTENAQSAAKAADERKVPTASAMPSQIQFQTKLKPGMMLNPLSQTLLLTGPRPPLFSLGQSKTVEQTHSGFNSRTDTRATTISGQSAAQSRKFSFDQAQPADQTQAQSAFKFSATVFGQSVPSHSPFWFAAPQRKPSVEESGKPL